MKNARGVPTHPSFLPHSCSLSFILPTGEPREVAVMTGDVTLESLEAFIAGEKMPLTIEFSGANSNKIFKSGISRQIITWGKAKDMAADSETMKVGLRGSVEMCGNVWEGWCGSVEGGDHHLGQGVGHGCRLLML